MKWNDKDLQYSGKNKSMIYNYVVSIVKKLSMQNKKISIPHIVNYILNDTNWDLNIFGTFDNHEWFIKELKTNPFLMDFLISEISKIKDFPNIYKQTNSTQDISAIKSEYFSQIIQRYIFLHPELPHYYFYSFDTDDIKNEAEMFAKNNYRKLKQRRFVLERKYSKLAKIRNILETELHIKSKIITLDKNIILQEEQNNFLINATNWGNFPIIDTNITKNRLFCISDDISVYFLGIATFENILKFSDKFYLFNNNYQYSQSKTAFYGFDIKILNFRKDDI